jgi:hypothetical protein
MPGLVRRCATLIMLTVVFAGCGSGSGDRAERNGARPTAGLSASQTGPSDRHPPGPSPTQAAELPQGGRSIFPAYRVVTFYGTAGNPSLGVLGESSPEGILDRLQTAAAGFGTPDRKIQLAYELIVTVAQANPGGDGTYSRMIDLADVQRYVDAAREHKLLVVLDVQPGRSDFLTQVKKLRPFLEQPYVGLALDPEWRMPPGQVPGRNIGQVSAAEVNAVSEYVAEIVRERNLPEKLFLLHQFRTSMIPDIEAVQVRPGLAMVQHIDGFGTRAQKDETYGVLRRPQQFHLGYKLFYDEDVALYTPQEVLAFQPAPEYVSYQ